MPLSTATITFDLSDHFGTDYDVRRGIRAWVDTNIDHDTVIDTDGNKVRVGSGKVDVLNDGTGSFTVWVPGVGSNPASWQTYLHVEYVPTGNPKSGRTTRTFGPFTITGNADLADLVDEQEVPPEYAGQLVAEMEALRDETSAISGLTGEDDAVALLVSTPGSDTATALSATIAAYVQDRSQLNILDFGVTRGTASSQTIAIKAALDANPGRSFYFPPGDYRLDTGLVISARNNLILDRDARIYAGAAMGTLISYTDPSVGYAEDRAIIGGTFDGNLLANTIMSIGYCIRFTLTQATFVNGINRGLVTVAGTGAELVAYDLRFHNTTDSNAADNIAIEANMGDSRFSQISMRDWTCAVKDTGANRWDRIHPWIGPNEGAGKNHMTARYPTSIGYDITGASDLQACISDTYRYAFKFRTNGTGYTAPPRLLNCRAMWGVSTLTDAIETANPGYVIDNTDAIGAVCDRLTVTGRPTVTQTFLTGPTTRLTTRNTFSYGFIKGNTGSTNDPLDYRDGLLQGNTTFTPTLYGSTGAGTHAYTAQTGRMVVNGDEVTYYVRVAATLDATTGFAGVMRIGGLPLPQGAASVRDGSGSVGMCKNVQVSNAIIFSSATPYIALLHQLPGGNPTSGTNDYAGTGSSAVEVGIPNLANNQNLRGKVVDLIVRVTATVIRP